MKCKFHLLLASLFIISLSASKCKKDKNTAPDNSYGLPNATQNGSNIFACRVNNFNFIANGKQSYPLLVAAQMVSDTLFAAGSVAGNVDWTLLIQINGGLTEGKTYNIDNSNHFIKLIADSSCLGITFNITQTNSISGSIQLTKFDPTTRIVSGLFHCVIPVLNCDTLKIAEGRFDIVYH